jgi:hypothetical protein
MIARAFLSQISQGGIIRTPLVIAVDRPNHRTSASLRGHTLLLTNRNECTLLAGHVIGSRKGRDRALPVATTNEVLDSGTRLAVAERDTAYTMLTLETGAGTKVIQTIETKVIQTIGKMVIGKGTEIDTIQILETMKPTRRKRVSRLKILAA